MYPNQQPQQQPTSYPQPPQQSAQTTPPAAPQHPEYRRGPNPLLFATIILGILAVGIAVFAGWAFVSYQDYKNNSDAKVQAAVAAAKAEQEKELEADFLEREKQPNLQFVGPDDLGHVTFNYPKTWSVYVSESSATAYEAYFNPGLVPKIASTQPYAARVQIMNDNYEDVLKSYDSLVKKGSLKSAPVTINGFTGIRLDGDFGSDRQGSTVLFKVRDKTLQISSDATTFKKDFDETLLKSLDFNP